jgi:prepilin-type N-terminal cleavage/methylation domain-containing protein
MNSRRRAKNPAQRLAAGFTLIEILVVVSIIGVLAMVSVVVFLNSREKARASKMLYASSQTAHAVGDELVGMWNFNECAGTTVTDLGNYGTDTITGATWSTDSPSPGCSLSFNGSSYIDVGALSSQTDNFTASALFKTTSLNDQKIISAGGSSIIQTASGFLRTCIGGVGCAVGTKRVDDGKWHLAVVVGDGESVRGYIDGSSIPDIVMPQLPRSMIGAFRIGDYSAGGYGFTGLLDDVRFYNKALTSKN